MSIKTTCILVETQNDHYCQIRNITVAKLISLYVYLELVYPEIKLIGDPRDPGYISGYTMTDHVAWAFYREDKENLEKAIDFLYGDEQS